MLTPAASLRGPNGVGLACRAHTAGLAPGWLTTPHTYTCGGRVRPAELAPMDGEPTDMVRLRHWPHG